MSQTNITETKSRKLPSRKTSISTDSIPQVTIVQIVQNSKKELDNMIDQLDNKIRKRIQHSEDKFLYAYQMHLQKITKQIKILKQANDNYEKKHSADHAITNLARQCSLFRQQAMRLHNQLEDSLIQADIYKRKSEILEGQIRKTNQSLKKYIALNRYLENQNRELLCKKQLNNALLQEATKQKINHEKQNHCSIIQTAKTEAKSKQKQNKKNKQTLKSELKIKIPQTQRSKSHNIKIIDLLNNNEDSFLLHTPKAAYTYSQYAVFSNNKINTIVPQSPNNNSFKQCNRTRNKTRSTMQHRNSSQRRINYIDNDVNSIKNQNNDKNFQAIGTNPQVRRQLEIFKNLMGCLEKARQSLDFQEKDYQLKSIFISQFIYNDEDINNLCQKLFPNLDINQTLTQFGTKFKAKAKQRSKTLAHLSAQLMKKIKVNNNNQIEKQKQKGVFCIPDYNLQIINEKSNIKTEANFQNHKKMNEIFKRKKIKNKSLLATFYSPISQHRKYPPKQ